MNKPRSLSPSAPDRADVAAAAAELLDLVRHLSGPEGCPWDKEQTPRTLSPYVVEEAHEVGDAIAASDRAASTEELGDLLFLAFFLAVTLEREGGAPPAAVLRANIRKMVARHPHVFDGSEGSEGGGGPGRDLGARGVLRQWEEGKRRETGAESLLGERPKGLPALLQAYRIQE